MVNEVADAGDSTVEIQDEGDASGAEPQPTPKMLMQRRAVVVQGGDASSAEPQTEAEDCRGN